MVMNEGRHGCCIIGQFTDVLRSLEGMPLEGKLRIRNEISGVNSSKLDTLLIGA